MISHFPADRGRKQSAPRAASFFSDRSGCGCVHLAQPQRRGDAYERGRTPQGEAPQYADKSNNAFLRIAA